jgi:hypothetical protein
MNYLGVIGYWLIYAVISNKNEAKLGNDQVKFLIDDSTFLSFSSLEKLPFDKFFRDFRLIICGIFILKKNILEKWSNQI